ncbi:MAG: hypothetical protein NT062_13590 [Proteobacteria bacterium]|nr:hypothetical protein [Pseudomonadota bacterium]
MRRRAPPIPKVTAPASSPPSKALAKAPALGACTSAASSVELCTCLVDHVDAWGTPHDVSKPVECTPRDHDEHGGVFEVRRTGEGVRGGAALVFAAKHGDLWSAVSAIDSAEAIDPEVQPKASNALAIVEFAVHPLGASTMYWIATREETQEKSVGEADRSGSARGSVCVSGATDTCFDAVVLAAWNYSFPAFNSDGKCTVSSIETYQATLSPSELRVELTGGKPDAGARATYSLDLAATAPTPPSAGSASPDGEVPFGKSDECVAIVTKIKACQADAAFARALDEGGDAVLGAKLRKQIGEWPKPFPTCETYFAMAFSHVGFLKDPDVLIEDHVLDSCEMLGTAIRKAGGLPGGSSENTSAPSRGPLDGAESGELGPGQRPRSCVIVPGCTGS